MDDEGRIGQDTEVGVYKSADACVVDFAVGRKDVDFIVLIY